MKHTKVIEIPATTKEVVDFVACDLCGDLIKERGYEVNNVIVEYTVGNCYPEGRTGTIYSVDMCGNCFMRKLMPWLIKQGAKLTEYDIQ